MSFPRPAGPQGQAIVDACALVLQHIIRIESEYQKDFVELALTHSDYGLLSSARRRENLRSHNVDTAHVTQCMYRQLVLVLELRDRVPAVRMWLEVHRSEWGWLYEWLRLESLLPTLGGRLSVLRRGPAKLERLRQLGEASRVPYQEEQQRFLVERAGYADVDGVYASTSRIHDSCLTYACVTTDIEYTLFRCCMSSKARRCRRAQAFWTRVLQHWLGHDVGPQQLEDYKHYFSARIAPPLGSRLQQRLTDRYGQWRNEYAEQPQRIWWAFCSIGNALLWQLRNQVVHEGTTWSAYHQLEYMWTISLRQLLAVARSERKRPGSAIQGLHLQISLECWQEMVVEISPVEPPPPSAAWLKQKEPELPKRLNLFQVANSV